MEHIFEVKRGYFEWEIYKDGKLFFVLDDSDEACGLSWDVGEGKSEHELKLLTDSYSDLINLETECFSDDELENLKNVLFEASKKYYNIV